MSSFDFEGPQGRIHIGNISGPVTFEPGDTEVNNSIDMGSGAVPATSTRAGVGLSGSQINISPRGVRVDGHRLTPSEPGSMPAEGQEDGVLRTGAQASDIDNQDNGVGGDQLAALEGDQKSVIARRSLVAKRLALILDRGPLLNAFADALPLEAFRKYLASLR